MMRTHAVQISLNVAQLFLLLGCSASPAERQFVNEQTIQSSGTAGDKTKASDKGSEKLSDDAAAGPSGVNKTPTPTPTPRDKLASGGAIYTAQFPGSHPDKVGTHVPQLSISGTTLTVKINHEMSKTSYIRWVQLRTVQGDILFEREFSQPPEVTGTAVSNFSPLPIDMSRMEIKKGQILYVYSSCGDHGIWREEIKIP